MQAKPRMGREVLDGSAIIAVFIECCIPESWGNPALLQYATK